MYIVVRGICESMKRLDHLLESFDEETRQSAQNHAEEHEYAEYGISLGMLPEGYFFGEYAIINNDPVRNRTG